MAIYLIFVILVCFSIFDAIKNTRLSFIKTIYLNKPIHWLTAFLILVFVCLINLLSYKLLHDTIFNNSLFSVFGLNNNTESTNVIIKPMELGIYVIIPYYLLLLWVLPTFAHTEEAMFRSYVTDWYKGIEHSIYFGLVHIVMGVPFFVFIPLFVFGVILFLIYRYYILNKQYSNEDATITTSIIHARYNIIIISLVTLFLIISQ